MHEDGLILPVFIKSNGWKIRGTEWSIVGSLITLVTGAVAVAVTNGPCLAAFPIVL